MARDTDHRIVVPVDPDGRQLLVFREPSYGYVDGWAIVWTDGALYERGVMVRLRFGFADPKAATSALVVRELYLTTGTDEPSTAAPTREISGRSLRNVALGRFEAAVNTATARAVLDPVLRVSSSFIATPWPAEAKLSASDERLWWSVPPQQPDVADRAPQTLKLEIPKGYGRPDSFYQEVGHIYSHLATTSNRPANELAEANDVPVTTVHGWVKEARKRGFLPARSPRGITR